MALDGAAVIRRYDRLVNDAGNFRRRWEMMAPFIAPSRRGIITQWSPGVKQTWEVYDSTTMMAAEMMAMFIASHVINPAQQWCGFELEDPIVGALGETREWMEECRDRYLRALGASFFYGEGTEALIDWCGFGTGFLLCEEAPQPVNRTLPGFRGFFFRATRTGRFVIAEGPDGLVDTAMEEYDLSARVANARWPGRCSQGLQTAAAKEPDKPYKFLHTIEPRPSVEQGGGALGMPWASGWVEKESKTVTHESGYRVFPGAVPRYTKTPGEVYGRGRGDLAWPDTWTLNTAKRMGLEDWALKIRPPILTRHDSVIGTLRLVPGAPTSVNTRGAAIRDVMMPYETGSKPEVSQLKEEELRKSIREIFFVEQIRQLMEVNKSEMTAFEFARKIELLFRIMGPVYGRSEWELLYRTVDVGFETMLHAGAFPPPPPQVKRTNGEIKVTFQNPIAKAQRAGAAEALTQVANDLSPFVQFFPQMLDRFDPDEISEGIAEIRGLPTGWQRSDEAMQKFRDAKNAAAAQQQQMEKVAQLSQAAGQAAPMVKALSDKNRPVAA